MTARRQLTPLDEALKVHLIIGFIFGTIFGACVAGCIYLVAT